MPEENKQRIKLYQKNIVELKNKHKKFFIFFSLHSTKMEQKALIFGEDCINKNAFHKNKIPINIYVYIYL